MAWTPEQTIAVVGVVGTLLGVFVGAVVAPWASGRSERRLHLLDRRWDAYTEALRVADQIRENAEFRSSIPFADLPELPSERVRDVDARIRVVGSADVRGATDDFARASWRFNAQLFHARTMERAALRDHGDGAEAMTARMRLAAISDEMTTAVDELEAAIRSELPG
jgi:hypothetical protein